MATQQELANLAKLYLAARNRLLNTIVNFKGVGTKVYANSVLQCLNRELEELAKATDEFIDTAIPAEYEKGLQETYDYFKKNNLLMKHPSLFADLHAEAIHTVAREMQFQIRQGLASVGRQILRYVDSARDEALRAVGLASSGEKIAAGATTVQMRQIMVKKLQDEGFMTVQYGSGARAFQVPLDTYAMLCARSTTREAGNLARENQLTANGYDLVQITEHYPTCDICAQFQGRVYSITGNDKRFPPLSRAFSSGYHNIHPNCRHVAVPFVESLQTPEEMQQAIERSNAPFKDTREKQEVELYNKQQAQNRRMREDLYQYERYKARLGPDAPKSFHGFRRIKKAGGKAWEALQKDYRLTGLIEQLGLVKADVVQRADSFYSHEDRLERLEAYLRDKPIRDWIASDEQPKTIDVWKQGKHIVGHANYRPGRSRITISPEKAQEIVNRLAGTGELLRDKKGHWRHQELVQIDDIIGVAVGLDGNETPTQRAVIHYSKSGTHIVPSSLEFMEVKIDD